MGANATQPPVSLSGGLILDSDQLNLVDGAETLVELDSIPAEFINGIENIIAHRILPPRPGVYMIVGGVAFKNCVVNKKYAIRLAYSGSIVDPVFELSNDNQTEIIVAGASIAIFDGTDFVELYATSYSGDNTVDVGSGIRQSFLFVTKVA